MRSSFDPQPLRQALAHLTSKGTLDQHTRARVAAAVERVEAAHAADPTLSRRGTATRYGDLIEELMRQLIPLSRQVAQLHTERVGGPVPPRTRINPDAEHEMAALTDRIAATAADIEGDVWHDWHTPAGQARWADLVMPAPDDIAALADRLRAQVAEAAAAGHPEARRLHTLAEQISPASPATRTRRTHQEVG